jgi:hypothetical protein
VKTRLLKKNKTTHVLNYTDDASELIEATKSSLRPVVLKFNKLFDSIDVHYTVMCAVDQLLASVRITQDIFDARKNKKK